MNVAGQPTTVSTAPDMPMILLAFALLMVGLVAISSASIEYADWHYQNAWYLTQHHLVYLLASIITAAAVYCVKPQFWLDTGWWWLFAALALLILVLIPGVGREVNGSQRWLPIGPFTLQPSEFAKLAVVVYLAGYMVRREYEMRNQWQGFLKPMTLLFAMTLLLMIDPDFGATVIVSAAAFGMLFLAGVKLGHFLLVLLGALAALLVLVVSEPYRVKRLTAYTDPWADPYNTGFQLTQSLIAFGRGEWFGVGLGNSVQKLFYLPEAHTDFVYSIWAEETGFVGVALIFSGQAFVNMGVSSGLLPTKGLTLPFVSYGGTSLIVCCAMVGLVLRIDRDTRALKPSVRRKK